MGNSPSSASGGGGIASPLSASTIVAPTVSGSHVVRIDGYSGTKGLGNEKFIKSEAFHVGGHSWYMHYYPDGNGAGDNADWIAIYLRLHHSDSSEVRALYKISLLDKDGQPVPSYSRSSSKSRTFTTKQPSFEFPQFIKRKDLEESPYLKDDVFSIRFDVTVQKDILTMLIPPTVPVPVPVPVPPSDMAQHLAQLLSAGEATDITFDVSGETFATHRCILAARSSVFKAELLGPMKEKTATHIRIHDMEAKVFKALLHFIYTDMVPEMDEADTTVMFQHLLVAADRYNVERLKLICEEKLCNHIFRSTVATTLALAEQHGCGKLKKACFKLLASPGNLKAIMKSDGFEHLKSSCPYILEELIANLAP